MKYRSYTADRFVRDSRFQRWVISPDRDLDLFWSQWLKDNPDKKKEVDEAIEIIKLVELDSDFVLNKHFIDSWQEIHPMTVGRQEPQFNYRKAAVWLGFLFVSAASVFWLLGLDQKQHFSTENKLDSFQLPDGSAVTLNSNSTLAYQVNKDGVREVWLEGEAFFNVRKWKPEGKEQPGKFVVHTQKASVEVLGTSFNLESRSQKTQLVLHSGEVRLLTPNQGTVDVQPGEFVEINDLQEEVVKKMVNPRLYSSWIENKVIFDHLPLIEIAEWIEDKYEMEVVLPGSQLDSVTFTATFPNVELEVLLEALAVAYELEITTEGKRIWIGR